MHTCDNRLCINPNHVIPGTHADNARERDRRGRTAVGMRHGRAKLSEAGVNEICWLFEEEWLSGPELARKFGVSSSTIYNVIRGRTWRIR
jgi:HTH domain